MDGPRVAVSDGPGTPMKAPADALRRVGLTGGHLVLGWTTEPVDWLDDLSVGSGTTVMGGYALRPHVARGAVRCLPTRLSAVPRLLAHELRPDIALVRAVPRGAGFCHAESVSWAAAAARQARIGVVAMVEPGAPDLGTPMITGTMLGAVEIAVRRSRPRRQELDPDLRAIGDQVASLIPRGATLQTGPGAIGDAVLTAVREPVAVWTGLATDALVDLAVRGLVTGPIVTTYLAGGELLRELAQCGAVRVRPIEETHDPGTLHQLTRFVAVNTAMEVGLDGSIGVDTVEGRHVSGIGGHPDFCAAAAMHPDGVSIIALRSEHHGISTIVPTVARVSTPRCDVDVVVTEHGVADLRGLDDAERARQLVMVASPAVRDDLSRACAGEPVATCSGRP